MDCSKISKIIDSEREELSINCNEKISANDLHLIHK